MMKHSCWYTYCDVDIAVMLKKRTKLSGLKNIFIRIPIVGEQINRCFIIRSIMFIRTTAVKEKLIEINNKINWKRSYRYRKIWKMAWEFGWLEPEPFKVLGNTLQSDYRDKDEIICIGSVAELKAEIEKSFGQDLWWQIACKFQKGDNSAKNYNLFDLHRPFVDEVVLVSKKGKKMLRENWPYDVWFDSGAMPYAQLHYPFENKDSFNTLFPADFIAEGVDQTRGWFFTLHAIAGMLFDKMASKTSFQMA